jgi:hypothetical protein
MGKPKTFFGYTIVGDTIKTQPSATSLAVGCLPKKSLAHNSVPADQVAGVVRRAAGERVPVRQTRSTNTFRGGDQVVGRASGR